MAPIGTIAFGVQVVILVALALAMLAPFATHRRNVLYGEGVIGLVGAALLLSGGAVAEYAYWTTDADVVRLVSYVLYTLASAVIAASMWYFARDFITLPGDDADLESEFDTGLVDGTGQDADRGGFEDG